MTHTNPKWIVVAVLVAVFATAIAFGLWIASERQEPSSVFGRCYNIERDDGNGAAKFERCLCEATKKHGCEEAKQAVPEVHWQWVTPCCPDDEDKEPVQLHD